MDTYAEFIVKRKKGIKDYLICTGACAVAFLCSFIVLSLQALSTYLTILFWLVVAIWYGAYRIIVSRNVEFEYAVTNGELDIDKIINRKRRKRILTVDAKSFDTFEPVSDRMLSHVKMMPGITVIHAEGDIEAPDTHIAVFNKNGSKYCLFFQPNERILDAIAKKRR